MKALVIARVGGPEALALQDVPEPSPQPGHEMVRVAAGGVNFADIMTTTGGYPGTPAPPFVAGREFAGVEETTGRRVMGYVQGGVAQTAARGRTPRVLIHAVAGGVGTAAVQIGKLLGIEMYGTSSSNEKLARVKNLGLQHSINYKESDYEEVIKELSRGEGVDAVFEMLGGEHTAKSLRCLRAFGRVIPYGPP